MTNEAAACNVAIDQPVGKDTVSWRRTCGCVKTSEKLKKILSSFPPPPPPTPLAFFEESGAKKCLPHHSPSTGTPMLRGVTVNTFEDKKKCPIPLYPILALNPESQNTSSTLCSHTRATAVEENFFRSVFEKILPYQWRCTTWHVITEVVQLVQLSVTATALALYYIIYCYMQLVYYTLRSAIYFHNADVPMKITIGVVTMTSLVVGFNLLLRMERVFGVFC